MGSAPSGHRSSTAAGQAAVWTPLIPLVPSALLVVLAVPALVALIVLGAATTALGGGSIVSGRTLDSDTGRALEGVNVFLAHTTYGTSSGPDGGFIIREVAEGSYTLVCSKIGYAPRMALVEFHRPDSVYLEMRLAQRPITLGEVEVTARSPEQWKRQLKAFVKAFLGKRDNAAGARLLNPEVLDFRTDWNTETLVAQTDSMLHVENLALGYRLDIVLVSFEWNLEEDAGTIVLYPRFTPLESADRAQLSAWPDNRRRTFEGSITHFLSALAAGRTEKEGFAVTSAGERLPDSMLAVTRAPGTPLTRWTFDGRLKVDYGGGIFKKASYLQLKEDCAVVDSLGFLMTPLCFEVSGEWAKYRVADMLPRRWQ